MYPAFNEKMHTREKSICNSANVRGSIAKNIPSRHSHVSCFRCRTKHLHLKMHNGEKSMCNSANVGGSADLNTPSRYSHVSSSPPANQPFFGAGKLSLTVERWIKANSATLVSLLVIIVGWDENNVNSIQFLHCQQFSFNN